MPGAVLQGSYNPADYPEHDILWAKKFGTITHNGLYVENMKALIIADRANHTGIKGEGTLKGAGEGKAFQLGLNKNGKPKNIFFIDCTDVLMTGISILNSAQITVSISGCERVFINKIYIRSLVNWNCDGLDVDAKDVLISNSIIDSEDDALCFKSEYLDKFCENITHRNDRRAESVFYSRGSAVRQPRPETVNHAPHQHSEYPRRDSQYPPGNHCRTGQQPN